MLMPKCEKAVEHDWRRLDHAVEDVEGWDRLMSHKNKVFRITVFDLLLEEQGGVIQNGLSRMSP